jgi:hypothetical protein
MHRHHSPANLGTDGATDRYGRGFASTFGDRYRLRLHGVPLRGTSRIAEYSEGEAFADEMLAGVYRHWHYRHGYRALPGGVEVLDVVDYACRSVRSGAWPTAYSSDASSGPFSTFAPGDRRALSALGLLTKPV